MHQSIITDNGPQFDNKVYINFCHDLKKKLVLNPTVLVEQWLGGSIQQNSLDNFEKASAFVYGKIGG